MSDAKKRFTRLQHSRELRVNSTYGEQILWWRIRNNKLGIHVRRQHPIGPFIADFYIAKYQLVIEIDGATHEEENVQIRDASRDEWMKANGYRVIRYNGIDVHQRPDEVVADLVIQLRELGFEAPLNPPT